MIQSLIPALMPALQGVINTLFTDPKARDQASLELARQLEARRIDIEDAAARIIETEAASTHWLAANWRPLTMIVFVFLIVARWFGFAAPELSEEEYLKLWSIVEIGLGGYVLGRSAEKIVPQVLKGRKHG